MVFIIAREQTKFYQIEAKDEQEALRLYLKDTPQLVHTENGEPYIHTCLTRGYHRNVEE